MYPTIQETKNREFLYALISRILMKEADGELLKLIESDGVKEFFPNFLNWEAYKQIDRETLINEHLNVDFAEISLVHLVPYETFYIRDDAMIDSGGENKALQFYDRFDFVVEKDKARVVSPDHIAVEFEFVYTMIDAQKKAMDDGDKNSVCEIIQLQREFLQNHLIKWAPLYLINVVNEATTPFYHDGALIALEFLLGDFEYLNNQCKN